MKKKLFFIIFVYLNIFSFAQNLIKNGSFEEYINCPTNTGEWFNLTDWVNPTATTPNYFNSCCVNNNASVPFNFSSVNGYQQSFNGNGYVQLICYYSISGNLRDYLQQELSKKLIAGQTYCGRFYVNLSNWSQYSINKVGMLFTDTSIYCSGACLFNFIPQIPSIFNTQLNDTLNWIELGGKFVSNGTEKFLTIGNFHANNNSNPILFNGTSVDEDAQYYFDDLSLTLCRPPVLGSDTVSINLGESILIGDTAQDVADYYWSPTSGLSNPNSWQTTASPIENTVYTVQKITPCDTTYATKTVLVHQEHFNVFPNPSNGTINFNYGLLKDEKGRIEICDCIGKLIYQETFSESSGSANLAVNLSAGSYFVSFYSSNRRVTVKKVVVIH